MRFEGLVVLELQGPAAVREHRAVSGREMELARLDFGQVDDELGRRAALACGQALRTNQELFVGKRAYDIDMSIHEQMIIVVDVVLGHI
jgi:hypothetical protein